MKKLLLQGTLLLLYGVFFLLPVMSVKSQTVKSETLVEIQDGVKVDPTGETGIVYPADEFWASYSFYHLYDSVQVSYHFVELAQGNNRIELANWSEEGYEKNKSALELSNISRSKSFVVSGDEISYCHHVKWFDYRPGYRQQLVDNFYCDGVLTYTVSAVNESTAERIDIEVLTIEGDGSGHILTTGGVPIEVVEWTPPASWNGVSAYIDITLTVSGDDLSISRRDRVAGRASTALTEPFYSDYYKQFNEPFVMLKDGEGLD